ncbi:MULTISPECIES: PAS domain-containing protein [Pseudomonas syringae group]|uniref:PAS domain-containing protein n=2 Tax=Pseudomonas syringae group TaxID=136849 RepID=A0ABX6H8S5_9PSED|nr:PAS domain-containing protein [Pseudomonas asturiensis]QHF01936.1 PAS domain-containing protein [Pseudomonas asturiensis]
MISATLLQQVIDASTDGIVVAEQEGEDTILIYANKGFTALTGYSPEEVLYQDCRFLQATDSQPEALEAIHNAIRDGQSCRQILRNYRKDGGTFWNELSITPVRNEADQLMYYIGIQKDVTAQVQNEQRIEELVKQLAEAKAEIEALKAGNS